MLNKVTGLIVLMSLMLVSVAIEAKENKPVQQKYKNVIWEGRFQPFHNGHLSYVKRLLEYGDTVWLVVLANETSDQVVPDKTKLPVPEFTAEVDPNHRAEKNPLPLWLRYLLVINTIREEIGPDAPVVVTMGHRLDLDWNFYKNNLPPDRIFVTPTRDSYEDSKARAWLKLGERDIRVDVSDLPNISGTMIRERIKTGSDVHDLISPVAVRILKEHGWWDKF